ncbi:MAG: glycine/sarcosine/betaine reductase complex component C subunit beta [Deltaproteobacteria bacterium]|nr:glycine/sarcosine/betaine reductase complex component C subunit beta [Deltaproteobacteria bacterium]
MSTNQPVIRGAATALAHTPSLVRYGSKPFRETKARPEFLAELARGLWSYDDACRYLPNQVFIGSQSPARLWEVEQPWFDKLTDADGGEAPFGHIMEERRFLALLACADPFKHVLLRERFWEEMGPVLQSTPLTAPLVSKTPALLTDARMDAEVDSADSLPLFAGGEGAPVGVVKTGHSEDEALSAAVLLENLCCKVSGALAVHELLNHVDGLGLGDVDLVLSCSEEAVGDRYQRGGGNMAKAIAEFAGCDLGTGIDIKDFCAAPIPAMVIGASLVESGVFENVVVVGGGSLPKLGMKSLYHLEQGIPVLEDALSAVAVWIGRDDGHGPTVNLRAVGRHPVKAGAALDKQFRELVLEPLRRLEWGVDQIDRIVTEVHNPDITVSAKAGDVAARNYKMMAAMLAMAKEIDRGDIAGFGRAKGVCGYAPTQGHIASGFVYVPHALREMAAGDIRNCMLVARASLFLGQMTEVTDGMSVLIERNGA